MALKQNVIVVGSGIFGTSTALAMLKSGEYDVTILDKSEVLPAPDAASTDINKIIRSGDYADAAIAALNVGAVIEWRKPEWEGTYHESGVLMIATANTPGAEYVESSYRNVKSHNIPARHLTTSSSIRSAFPQSIASSHTTLGSFSNKLGYLNPLSGWAEAARAVEVGLNMVEKLGGKVYPGKEVVGLIEEDETLGKRVKGVRLAGGDVMRADLVVVACGSWTPALFAQPGMEGLPSVVATGQSVAKIQLTPEEAAEYADTPVMFDMDTGFYVFPPNPQHLVKVAIHGAGYVNTSNPPNPRSQNEVASQASGVSTPRTVLTPGAENGMIPKKMVQDLREGLRKVYPKLAEKDFVVTRLCWYADTPDGDWLIDWHPSKKGLLLATAGCGHAFKFFPNIGEQILAKVRGTLSPGLAHKWRFHNRTADRDASTDSDLRGTSTRASLIVSELATNADLLASSKARL